MIAGLSSQLEGLAGIYEEFVALGCDRCNLVPCIPSCEIPEIDIPDLCAVVVCPAGLTCDPATGQCCDDAGTCVPPTFDPCDFISCGYGEVCNSATAQCEPA